VTTFSKISWTRTDRLQRFLAHLLLRLWAIDRYFQFLASPISCSYFTSGNYRDLNIMNLALNCEISQCCNTTILPAKLSPYYFTYLLFNLRFIFYNGTITRFIADDEVVYQWMRREIRLASDNSWPRRRLKHLSWRSQCRIIRCTLEQRVAGFTRNLTSFGVRRTLWEQSSSFSNFRIFA